MNPPVNTASESAERLCQWSRLVLLSSLLVSASCDDGGASGSGGALASWTLSDEPSVVIGGADEREGYLLHQVVGAARLGDGRIVVANGSTLQLRYYDPKGTHLFDAGGEGEGPGEFQSLVHLTRLPEERCGGLWAGMECLSPNCERRKVTFCWKWATITFWGSTRTNSIARVSGCMG